MKYCILFSLIAVACLSNAPKVSNADKCSKIAEIGDSLNLKLVNAAKQQTLKKVTYDGRYFTIPYPNGDIPDSLGVCTDVIIRAYRQVGFDLQKLVHEDMKRNFAVYKKKRNSLVIDRNIDHRRVPNLETYFMRFGKQLSNSTSAADYLPGDIVCWDIAAGHIGIVSNCYSEQDSTRLKVVHNIGLGPKMEDYLFKATITGHYRFTPWKK